MIKRVVHKYLIDGRRDTVFSHYPNLKPLHVGSDPHGDLCLWAEVDAGGQAETSRIEVYGTGHIHVSLAPGEVRTYVGSAVEGSFVWHVYVVTS